MNYAFNPVILFYGRCEEALDFYKEHMKGEIRFLSRYKETGMEIEEKFGDKIIHAEFWAHGVFFMASDGRPQDFGKTIRSGAISLSINFEEVAEEERLFAALSDGGKIIEPLQDQFWGARYGVFSDRFGVRWEFNCQKS